MTSTPRFSIIVPVYNRPEEVSELLESLVQQPFRDFEVVLVEDGSTRTCLHLVSRYVVHFAVRYEFVPNAGPGPARNIGVTLANGRYVIFFDSDCLIPAGYFSALEKFLSGFPGTNEPQVAWGGPDAGHPSFTPIQQGMAYTMSSVLTTGGIRGGKQARNNFQPRSFNMGMHRDVFQAAGGFKFDRSAEDIELSLRIRQLGFPVGLIEDAFVWHKRRTTLGQFYKQVFRFAEGRVAVARRHPGTLKLVHLFPMVFTLGWLTTAVLFAFVPAWACAGMLMYLVYLSSVAAGAWLATGSPRVGLLAIPSVLVQFAGYGLGMLKALVHRG